MYKTDLKYGNGTLQVNIPRKNLIYTVAPKDVKTIDNEDECIRECLRSPIAALSLYEQLKPGMEVVILLDDLTRTTPKNRILPVLLNELNKIGISDKNICGIIALGTHRYMTNEEIVAVCGKEATERIKIMNHMWKDNETFVDLGYTTRGTPVIVNKELVSSDYVIGIGSVVPHEQAGFSGGAKIVQPGVCSWETTGYTHMLAAENGDYLGIAGNLHNSVRLEIEEVGRLSGLDFVLNVVVDRFGNCVKIVGGDPVYAQREATKTSGEVYIREIPELADIAIVGCYPAELDYWQGLKPLSYAQRGIKEGGTIILVGQFNDGIANPHPDLEDYAGRSSKDIENLIRHNVIGDRVCAAALKLHSLILERCHVVCVSEGLSSKQKDKLGFEDSKDISTALNRALFRQGKNAKIGVIDYGGDVLPKLRYEERT